MMGEKILFNKEDVTESFIRSSGPGGQNVNKVATCVVLCHKPSGLIIKCQQHRSQFLNRQDAWLLLQKALEAQQEVSRKSAIAHREKKRRQNRKPSVSAKERTLTSKKKRAVKKSNRRMPKENE